MGSTAKSNPESPGAGASAERQDAKPLADTIQKGVERLIDAHKKVLDVAGKQNTAAIKAVKEGFRATGSAPAAAMADQAEQISARLVEAQKSILDLAVQQSGIAINAAEFSNTKLASGMADTVQRGMESIAATHKTVLDFAATQNSLVADLVKKQMETVEGGQAFPFADSVRDGIDTYINLQRKFLELVAEQNAAAFRTAADAKIPAPAKEFTEFARKGMDALAETQKRFFDIATRAAKAGFGAE